MRSSNSSREDDSHHEDGEHEEHEEEEGPGVYPKEVFTGYDEGEHEFVVPVSAHGGKANWTTADESIVSLDPSDKGVKITSKGAGSTIVTAKIGTKLFTVKVTVTAYAKGAWKAGEAVYTGTAKCDSCHLKSNGPDHSPSEIAQHEDDHVKKRIMTGESLHGEETQANHKFAAKLENDADLEGVVAYIRALKPNGWPKEAHEH